MKPKKHHWIILLILVMCVACVATKEDDANNPMEGEEASIRLDLTTEVPPIPYDISEHVDKTEEAARRAALLKVMTIMPHDELIDAIENLTDQQLIDIADGTGNALVPDFTMPDTFSIDFIEDEGAGRESWYAHGVYLAGSVSSASEAEVYVKDFISGKKYEPKWTSSIEYIGENDLYYQYRLQVCPPDYYYNRPYMYTYRMVFYKDDIISFDGEPRYTLESGRFNDVDKDIVLQLMDLECFFNMYNDSGYNLLYRYMDETEDAYLYTYYSTLVTYGDWGLDNSVSLYKHTIPIDKQTGKIKERMNRGDKIKANINIPGTAPQMGSGG